MTTSAERTQTRVAGPINVPNIISALRFPLAVAFPLLDGLGARAAVVIAAAFSDWIDGRLARRTAQVTRAGELLDPIADKTFMLVVLVTLVLEGRVPLLALPLLLVRDIGVAAGVLVLALRGSTARMPARRAGKLVTWLQFLAITIILIQPSLALWVAIPVAVAGAVALRDYARAALS